MMSVVDVSVMHIEEAAGSIICSKLVICMDADLGHTYHDKVFCAINGRNFMVPRGQSLM